MSKFNRMSAKKELYTKGFTPSDLKDKTDEELKQMLEVPSTEKTIEITSEISETSETSVEQSENLENLSETIQYNIDLPDKILDTMIDNLEVTTISKEEYDEKIVFVPDYLSPEWPDYVLSKFSKDELNDGAPNVHGLRRVAQVLLGTVLSTRILQLNAPADPTTYGRASVIYEIQIEFPDGMRVFQDVGGAYPGNTDKEYAKYPEAIAATRAEARCLRKALRIQGPASEEVCLVPTTENITVETIMSNKISPTQLSMLKNRCKEYNIHVEKFILKETGEVKSIENLSRENAQKLCSKINEYQTNRADITEDIKENA